MWNGALLFADWCCSERKCQRRLLWECLTWNTVFFKYGLSYCLPLWVVVLQLLCAHAGLHEAIVKNSENFWIFFTFLQLFVLWSVHPSIWGAGSWILKPIPASSGEKQGVIEFVYVIGNEALDFSLKTVNVSPGFHRAVRAANDSERYDIFAFPLYPYGNRRNVTATPHDTRRAKQ